MSYILFFTQLSTFKFTIYLSSLGCLYLLCDESAGSVNTLNSLCRIDFIWSVTPPQKGAALNVKYAIWFIPPTIWEKYEKSKKRAKYDFGRGRVPHNIICCTTNAEFKPKVPRNGISMIVNWTNHLCQSWCIILRSWMGENTCSFSRQSSAKVLL